MKAVVKAPVCPLMSQPRPDCPMADEALHGMVLEVLEEPAPGWRRVRTSYRYEGYAPADSLILDPRRVETWVTLSKKLVRHKNAADVMPRPDIRALPRLTLPLGGVVVAVGESREGWQRVELADGERGYIRAGVLADLPASVPDLPEETLRARLVETALAYRDTPYRWGGKTPVGIDCSGLVSMAYLLNGITVYRDARLEPGFDLAPIDPDQMKPGDAIFFPGHVALYLGRGRYLHATGRAGDDGVSVNSLDPHAPDYRPDLAQTVTQVGSYKGFHR